jgi:hypothetical protein
MVKKIVWFLVAAILLVAIGLTVFVELWDRDVEAALVAPDSEIPLDWEQQIRQLSSLPGGLRAFAADSTIVGNAAEVLLNLRGSESMQGYERVYGELTTGGVVAAADSGMLTAVLADPELNNLISASAMESYNSVEILRSAEGSESILYLSAPDLRPVRSAFSGLLLRSFAHIAAGETDSARADIGAAFRIGRMMYEQATTLPENVAGRWMLQRASEQLSGLAVALDDSTMATLASGIGEWSETSPNYQALVSALRKNSDQALEIVRNTDVLAAWRSEGISQLVFLEYRPKNIPLGISSGLRGRISNFRSISDPRVAWTAEIAEKSIDDFNRLSMSARVALLRGAN